MDDKVDILLATYQGSKYLEAQLKSIFSQTHDQIHLRVRDDGSNDGTLAILEKWKNHYPEKITIIPSTQRLGIKGNFSELMKKSSASYVMLADQDDIWLPFKIKMSLERLKMMEKKYGAHLPLAIHTDLKVVNQDLSEISTSFWKYSRLKPDLISLNRLLPQNVVTGSTMLINRPLVELAAPIPEGAIMHDWWICLVAACFGHIEWLRQPTILYRQHSLNDTGAKHYSFWEFLKNPSSYSKNNISKTYQQASCFLNKYVDLLSLDKQHMIKAYTSLEKLSFFKRACRLVKYRFFKQGLLRNLKMFFMK